MATKKSSKRVGTVNVRAEKVNVASEVGPSKYVEPEERKSGWSEWELKDAIRTLTNARKIRKNPALMRAIRKHAAEQVKAIQAITTGE